MAQTKTIDITPARIKLPVIEVSQFDIGRPIIIHMKDGDEWYDLTGYTVKLQGTKPSGFGYSVTGVVSGHDVTFTTTYDMTSEAGFILSEVSIIDGESPIGSQNAMLHVEQSPHLPEVVDGSPETILPEMRELVNRAEAAAEILLDCSAIATTLPTGASATASYSPETGVFSFGLPRGAKGETGETGAAGNGIASIAKTGTSGLVDTYTITYTNGTTTTFTVTNGQNGTGSVADVTQNGVSVLDGTTAKVTVPTYDAVTDNEPYLFRTSGGGVDIGNREVDTLVGGSVAWNQLAKNSTSSSTVNGITFTNNGDGSWTVSGTATADAYVDCGVGVSSIPVGHKMYIGGCPVGGSASTYMLFDAYVSYVNSADTGNGRVYNKSTATFQCRIYVWNGTTISTPITYRPHIIDLTQLFGTTVADAIYAMEQSTSGSGVAFFKSLFPNSYYPFSSGELMSVSGVSSHDMTGFNQWDEEWESGIYGTTSGNKGANANYIRNASPIKVVPNTTYYAKFNAVEFVALYYDASGTYTGLYESKASSGTIAIPQNAVYMNFYVKNTTYAHDICINRSSSRNGEYEPYVKHSYALDSTLTLRGIPKLSNGKLYYDGDTYASDGTVTRKYGVTVLNGSEDGWGENARTDSLIAFTKTLADAVEFSANTDVIQRVVLDTFVGMSSSDVLNRGGAYDAALISSKRLYLKMPISVVQNTAAFKTWLTTHPITVVYELATPTTETAEPYTNPQVVDDFGTEEYVSTSIVPVGHQTAYPDLFSGDYNDLVNKPTIPTETSQLTNDSDFVIDASYVHTDNNFTTTLKDKLDGIASGAEVNVQADWNEQSSASDAYIANKPTIPTVPAWAQAPSKPTYTASEVGAATADHVHGYITNGGDITASATIANGDRLVINDESASKVLNSSITFGTATNTYLRNNGTWGAPKTSTTASLTVAGWSSSTQTVTVTGVTTTNDVIVSPAPASYDAYVSAGIRCTAQANNSLTFTCTTTPTEAITVNVLIIL